MISTWKDFEDTFNEVFGNINRTSLASLNKNRLRIELGGEGNESVRVIQAIERSTRILQYCFEGKDVWLRLVLWSKDEKDSLKSADLSVKEADRSFYLQNDEEKILYLLFNEYKESLGVSLATSIVNYELALEPSANITCYFINLKEPIIINIYDDRGMDVFSPSNKIIDNIKNEFSTWLLE